MASVRMRGGALYLLVAVAVIGVGLSGCSDESGEQRVLVVPRVNSADMDYMLTNEVGVMLDMLESAGVEAVVALPDAEALVGSEMSLEADLALGDVVVSDYDGILLPCMAAAYEINDMTVEIVREAEAAGLPMAAQYGSVFALAKAGALEGRQYALDAPIQSWIVEDEGGGIYSGTGVVQDGNVITSGTCSYMARSTGRPDGTPELTQSFIELLAEA